MRLCHGADHGGGDGPSFVVSPGAVDEQQFRGVALAAEAKALDQLEGGMVAGLNIGFEPVKPQLLEGIPHYQAKPFGHVTLACGRREGGVAKRAALEAPADDAVDVD